MAYEDHQTKLDDRADIHRSNVDDSPVLVHNVR